MTQPGSLHLWKVFLTRELRTRYTGTLAALAWPFIGPLVLLLIYSFVFERIFQARVPEAGAVGFTGFLAIGLWPWLAFSEAVNKASGSILGNAALIHKTTIPAEIYVHVEIAATFLIHVLGFALVLLVLAIAGKPLHWQFALTVPFYLAIVYLFASAFGLLFGALQVFLRDLEHALPLFLTIWFFATPILYSPTLIPVSARHWFVLNPMATLVSRLRDGLIGGHWQAGVAEVGLLSTAALSYIAARWFFNRCSPRFEDFV